MPFDRISSVTPISEYSCRWLMPLREKHAKSFRHFPKDILQEQHCLARGRGGLSRRPSEALIPLNILHELTMEEDSSSTWHGMIEKKRTQMEIDLRYINFTKIVNSRDERTISNQIRPIKSKDTSFRCNQTISVN